MIYKLRSKLVTKSRKIALKANYFLNNYDDVIWLLGDGRSGTTWVSNLINHRKSYREMFEPFHPRLIPEASFMVPHQYIRTGDDDLRLRLFCADIFSGRFTSRRGDSENKRILYNGLLIKDIFANLLCYWATTQFPKVRPVLLIRNPFSVATSKLKKKNWLWTSEPLDFLNQKTLTEDYLFPFEDLIRKVSSEKNYVLNQITIWAIINYVPLRQFSLEDLHVCFYESIYEEPHKEILKIMQFVKKSNEVYFPDISTDVITRPSRVVGSESNLISGTSPIDSWKNELSSMDIDRGLRILEHFGFDGLYDDRNMPNKDQLVSIRTKKYSKGN